MIHSHLSMMHAVTFILVEAIQFAIQKYLSHLQYTVRQNT